MVLQLKRGHANCSGTSTSSAFFVQVDYFRLARQPTRTHLSAGDRILAGLLALLVRPTRLLRSAIVLKPSTLLGAGDPHQLEREIPRGL